MNKRTVSRCGALVASVAFATSSLVASVSAASKYDLNKYVDEFDMQTFGMRVEATSDGGYIVGGKTVACLAFEKLADNLSKLQEDAGYEIVDMKLCESIELDRNSDSELISSIVVSDYCSQDAIKEPVQEPVQLEDDLLKKEQSGTSGEADDNEEDNVYYEIACMDYMAKYNKDGKGLWMTPVEDWSDVLAVGETANDYRMVTKNEKVYVFDKTDGKEDYFQYDGSGSAATINSDGSFIVYYHGLHLFSKTGQYVREFDSSDFYDVYYDVMALSAGKILVGVSSYDEDSDTETYSVISISNDLKTIETRLSTDKDYIMPMSGSKNGDMVIYREIEDEDDHEYYKIESYDKDNKLIAELKFEEGDEGLFFMNDYVATNDVNLILNRLINGGFGADDEEEDAAKIKPYLALYSRDLKETARVELTGEEIVNDITILNDGTLVTAGGVTGTNDDNGLRIHLAAAISSNDNPTSNPGVPNPDTGDGIQFAGIVGGVAALGAAVLASKKFARR